MYLVVAAGGNSKKIYIFLRRSPYSVLFYPNSHSYLGFCEYPFMGRGGGGDGVGVWNSGEHGLVNDRHGP